jgi:choice-of-anchor C domain-containing protein
MVRTRRGLGILATAVALIVGLATAAAAGTETDPNLVRNGNFERPEVPEGQEFLTIDQGEFINNENQWRVARGSVDVLEEPAWEAAKGNQSLDLNGSPPGETMGAIAQRIEGLTAGETYVLRFAIAGNPECKDDLKRLRVFWAGQLLAEFFYDASGQTPSDLDWVYRELEIIAEGTSAVLRFASRTEGLCGPLLDDVSLRLKAGTTPE